jgi:Vitamin K-dependent gamma-carboxylase
VTRPWQRPVAAWQRFWFDPRETSSLALFRIAFGLVVTAWTATQAPDLLAFYGPHGILPEPPDGGPGSWGVLSVWPSSGAVVGLFAVTLTAAVCLTVGLFPRIAAVLVWIGVVSFEHRNGLVGNSGDGLIRNLAFFCALAPSGAALSVDRLRKARDRFWEFPARAPWALRLVQLQLSIGYLSAVWSKSGNQLWRDGTAVSYALRIADVHRAPTPGFVTSSVVLVELLTYGTLALELALGVLVWNRVARPWVLLLGVVLHLSIDASILVGFFSLAMLAGYLAFVPPGTAARRVLATRDALGRLRPRRAADPGTGPAPAPGEIADAG